MRVHVITCVWCTPQRALCRASRQLAAMLHARLCVVLLAHRTTADTRACCCPAGGQPDGASLLPPAVTVVHAHGVCTCIHDSSRWTYICNTLVQRDTRFSSCAGLSPYSPSYGTSVGSCGFGYLARNQYPFWAVGALSTSNHYFQNEPEQACGECFEVPCMDATVIDRMGATGVATCLRCTLSSMLLAGRF